MISAVTQNEQLDFLGHNMHIMSLIIRKLDRNACQQIGVRNMFHQENVGNLAIASSWKGWAGPLIITKQSQNPGHGLESGKPLFCNGSTSRKRNWSTFYTTWGKLRRGIFKAGALQYAHASQIRPSACLFLITRMMSNPMKTQTFFTNVLA